MGFYSGKWTHVSDCKNAKQLEIIASSLLQTPNSAIALGSSKDAPKLSDVFEGGCNQTRDAKYAAICVNC
jgi:hypothetical protein